MDAVIRTGDLFRRWHPLGIVVALLGATGLACFGGHPPPPVRSPSGHFVAFATISGPEAGGDSGAVALHVTDQSGQNEVTIQTHASDQMKWALAWNGEQSLVLYSADDGTTAYDLHAGSLDERAPTAGEQKIADDAYADRYGHPPGAQ